MAPTWPTLPIGYVATGRHTAARTDACTHAPGHEGPRARDWLADLMERPRYAGRLNPEEALSVECAAELRGLTAARELRCVWFRVANEVGAGGRGGEMHQAKALAMGVVKGAFDLAFMWDGGAGGIELKRREPQSSLRLAGGKLVARQGRRTHQRGAQPWFELWCEEQGVAYALARSVREMLDVLRKWGRLA